MLGLYLSSLFFGIVHAFEADHMVAVSNFIVHQHNQKHQHDSTSIKTSALYGMQWAFGHGLSLICIGTILFIFKLSISSKLATNLEHFVGYVLIALGTWTLLKVFFLEKKESFEHKHGSFFIGILHGTAGSAAFVGESIAVFSESYLHVFLYTLCFSFGVLLGMAFYGILFGKGLKFSQKISKKFLKPLQTGIGLCSIYIGILWLAN